MTIVQATIVDSVGNPLDGFIRVTLQAWLRQGILTSLPLSQDFELIDGSVEMDLEPSDIAGVRYLFEVYQNVSGIDPDTGDPIILPTLVRSGFLAEVPSQALMTFNDLLSDSVVDQDTLNDNVVTFTNALINRQYTYSAVATRVVRGYTFWESDKAYQAASVVFYDGQNWGWMDLSNLSPKGIPPDTPGSGWDLLIAKGGEGTGVTGNTIPYDVGLWDGEVDAPSRGVIRDLVEGILVKREALSPFAKVVGTISTYPDVTLPSTYLECDGSLLDPLAYPELFTTIGYTFGQSGVDFALPLLGAPVGTRRVIYVGE